MFCLYTYVRYFSCFSLNVWGVRELKEKLYFYFVVTKIRICIFYRKLILQKMKHSGATNGEDKLYFLMVLIFQEVY